MSTSTTSNYRPLLKPTMADLFLLPIQESNISWAIKDYPQFLNEKLGEKRQINYLLSRALLLHLLQQLYQIATLPKIAYGIHGKPYFPQENLSFNLTHTDHWIGLLIAKGNHPLGIDLETIKPRRNIAGLLQKIFQPDEIQWILGYSIDLRYPLQKNLQLSEQALERFFLLWSAKEAYLKADGRGIQALPTLHLKPAQQSIEGSLKKGTLLLRTLSESQTTIRNTLALYLPSDLLAQSTINYLSEGMIVESDPILAMPTDYLILQDEC